MACIVYFTTVSGAAYINFPKTSTALTYVDFIGQIETDLPLDSVVASERTYIRTKINIWEFQKDITQTFLKIET